MNECYALDPDAPLDARELKLLMDQFGMSTGRFLARYPEGWPSMIIRKMEAISEMDRQRAIELLRSRRSHLMPVEERYDFERRWANNAAVAAERKAIDAVIGQRENGFGWVSPEQVLYSDTHVLPPGQGDHVPMTAACYAELARPLFVAAAEVILVDRYFTLHDMQGRQCRRRWPVLQSLLRAAERGSCECIRLVLERRQIEATAGTEERFEKALAHALNEAAVSRLNLDYEVRNSVGHGRYLISIYGGMQFDQGFEERAQAKNHLHWLSEPELRPLLKQYARSTSLALRQ